MSIKQAIEALAEAVNAFDSMGDEPDRRVCPEVWKAISAEQKIKGARAALAALRAMPTTLGKGITRDDTVHGEEYFTRSQVEAVLRSMPAEPVANQQQEIDTITELNHAQWLALGKASLLVAACNRLSGEAEEFDFDDGLGRGAPQAYWDEFEDALEQAAEAIDVANKTIHQDHIATPHTEAVRMSEAWQPIETAPKDGTAVLVSEGRFIHCVEWNDEYEWWAVDDNKLGPFRLRGTAPTHWQPLPPPPVEQATAARLGVKMGDAP